MFESMIPRNKKDLLKKSSEHPLESLHQDINRLFENFFTEDWPLENISGQGKMMLSPKFDVTENDKSIEITAELAGVEEKDLDVSVDGKVLTVKGEKKEEVKEDKKDYHLSERRYGSFRRSFTLPDGLDLDKVEASFKSGVLKISIPKTAEAKTNHKKIKVAA
jgi:HSP20 family protein